MPGVNEWMNLLFHIPVRYVQPVQSGCVIDKQKIKKMENNLLYLRHLTHKCGGWFQDNHNQNFKCVVKKLIIIDGIIIIWDYYERQNWDCFLNEIDRMMAY